MAPTWLEKRNDWTGPRYSSSVFGSLRSVDQLLLAYGPQPSFDDMAWYGLAYARSFWIANSNYNTQSPSRIYEVTQKKEFLQRSKDIFDWVIIYYLTLILSVFDIVSKLSFIFHSLFLLNKYSYEVTCWLAIMIRLLLLSCLVLKLWRKSMVGLDARMGQFHLRGRRLVRSGPVSFV